ncbi:MAG: hypothetical protein JO310_07020 [Hyphomicrobiales bacterium]|nr:hypothetical protein [Hyphomicrobiales bacterium]MBV9751674.1 hypothetical protein [Hyphomicrobiales bacterium]
MAHRAVSPFNGTVHAFNSGIHPGYGGLVGHVHHRWRHRYAWWDVPYWDDSDYGACYWRHRWVWNGYREVRELVRICS